MKRLVVPAVLLVGLLGLPAQVKADPITLSMVSPDFLIPLAGQNGVLTVFSNGSTPQTSGFNALGSQTFTLAGNSTSTGSLTLNLVFTGGPLGGPIGDISAALLSLRVFDFDFITDQVTQQITLREMAVLNRVNGQWLTVGERIDLNNYLPGGTPTDERWVSLNAISLMPGPLESADFIDPLMLSFTLTATARNYGSQAVTLINTSEALLSNVSLTLTPTAAVPEPSTLLMLGPAAVAGLYMRRRRRSSAA